MEFTVPPEVDALLQQEKGLGKYKRILRLLRIYEALLFKRGKHLDWFEVPHSYLDAINHRYNFAMKILQDNKIIEYKKSKNGRRLFYPGKCMSYRFIIDTSKGYDINLPSTRIKEIIKDKKDKSKSKNP